MKKTVLRFFVPICLLLIMLTVLPVTNARAVDETEISPRYTGISKIIASLSISTNGYAECTVEARPRSGYSVNLTMNLQQDGITIKSWTNSGEESCSIDEGYNVTKGHSYQVIAIAEAIDSRGTVVETVTEYSKVQSY